MPVSLAETRSVAELPATPLLNGSVSFRRGSPTWAFRSAVHEPLPASLVQAAGQSPLMARLLWNRGLQTADAVEAFLAPRLSGHVLDLPDAAKALERLKQAIESQEAILVYGDFDVDGLTGTTIWMEALTALGAQVSYYIPNRSSEGHGLNTAALCRLVSSRKLKLVVTTDTGIANFSEVSLLNGLGVDTIVTDHHELPEALPPAVANVNPLRLTESSHAFASLSGAGVAYVLASELLTDCLPPEAAQALQTQLLDLAAIGLVADLVPLRGEARRLTRLGLEQLKTRQRPALAYLLEQAGVAPEAPLTSETIGFTIGPRLNAVGRLADAGEAVELLLSKDSAKIHSGVHRLEQLNQQRQKLCEQTFLEAQSFIAQQGGLHDEPVLVLASPAWHAGIIGIVASRLVEQYQKPAFLLVVDETKNEARCSARSTPSFHLSQCLDEMPELFTHYGGHAGAAGFALPLERLSTFKARVREVALRALKTAKAEPKFWVDCPLRFEQLNEGLLGLQQQLAPFGMQNPAPLYLLESVRLKGQRLLGEDGKHLKCLLSPAASKKAQVGAGYTGDGVEALFWNQRERFDPQQVYRAVVSVEPSNPAFSKQPLRLTLKALEPLSAKPGDSQLGGSHSSAFASALPLPTLKPLPAQGEASEASLLKVIDERSSEQLRRVELAWLQPQSEASPQRTTLLFHEGRSPDLPGFDSKQCFNRIHKPFLTEPAAEELPALRLWDWPPSPAVLVELLQYSQAKTLYLAGGKYQHVPVQNDPKRYLQGVLQLLTRLSQKGETQVSITFLASTLATTEAVVLCALNTLAPSSASGSPYLRVQQSERALLGGSDASVEKLVDERVMVELAVFFQNSLDFGLVAEALGQNPLNVSLHQLQQAVAETVRFRQWLATAPFAELQAWLSPPGALTVPAPWV